MSNSDAYELISSDEDFDEPPQTTTCASLFKVRKGYPIKRKVIDPLGRLGSLYDASTDNLIDRHAVKNFDIESPHKRSICLVFAGDQSRNRISFLREVGFNDRVQQSIRQRSVTPVGTSRFIEYGQPINQNTRFLYYSYKTRKEMLNVKARKAHKIVGPPPSPTRATYMITKILWGIEILCVIQISKNQSVDTVDQLLRHIRNQLKNNSIPVQLTNDDQRLINQLTNITVFGSETCVDDPNTSLLTVLSRIRDWQRNAHFHQPLEYTMQPLRWLYNNIQFPEPCNESNTANRHIARIQARSNRIENQLNDIGEIFHNFPTNFSSPILNQRLRALRQHYQLLLDTQEDLDKRLQKVIPDVRRQSQKPIVLDNIIEDLRYRSVHENEIKQFRENVELLLQKAILIEKLKNDRIEYVNAFDVCSDERQPTTNEAIDAILKRSFSNENGAVILWYSGDRLKREQADEWKQIYQELILERQETTQLIKLVYVDFTQCPQRLDKFVIARLSGTERDYYIEPRPLRARPAPSIPKQSSGFLVVEPKQPDRPITPPLKSTKKTSRSLFQPSPPSTKRPPRSKTPPVRTKPSGRQPVLPEVITPRAKTEINILLLGETGVGKSTFINAFVNYLKFETLEQAERGEPVVLIPVSFLITVGDQFDEFIVKFGNVDPNEDHEHHGQSVTQHCKSYVFDLNERLILRLIDTPGIGDTRGVDQDVKNIDHILTYINTLPHLNAVCLLLKPNASRLNVFFRSCVRQLLTYLTPIGYNNIIFCFTNARATFYAPGETGRLLREMLNQEHLDEIPFQKQNTFCFDSESFRYLAARKCQIDFDDYQKGECKNSWNTSVTESVRLLKFIQTREPYYLEAWQSPRKATLDISMLAQPLMETLRLIIYNWKLNEAKLIFNQVILNSYPVDIEMCTHCAQTNLVEVGPFWVTQYQPTRLKTNANQHRLCPLDGTRFLIEAIVEYTFAAEGAGLKNERWQSSFHNFLLKCDRIQHFLRQQGPSVQDDPFEPILERFLEEEQQISQIRNINSDMNRRVREVLQSIKQIRPQNSQQLFETNERLSLRQVYQIIDELVRMPTVEKQIDSIKKSRQLIMKAHELTIPANLIKNKIFN